MSLLEQAKAFRTTFRQKILGNISEFGVIDQDLWNMQAGLVKEEAAEFAEAVDECFADPENVEVREALLKELSDLVFVCYQFAAAFGLDLDKAMTLVFESNMSKLDEQGNPIFREDGKVLKGPKYMPPHLLECLPAVRLNFYDTYGK